MMQQIDLRSEILQLELASFCDLLNMPETFLAAAKSSKQLRPQLEPQREHQHLRIFDMAAS